jgi:hypothetical protein
MLARMHEKRLNGYGTIGYSIVENEKNIDENELNLEVE